MKFNPEGRVVRLKKLAMEIPLAGRVAKGKTFGCLSCHSKAPGADYVFAPEANMKNL